MLNGRSMQRSSRKFSKVIYSHPTRNRLLVIGYCQLAVLVITSLDLILYLNAEKSTWVGVHSKEINLELGLKRNESFQFSSVSMSWGSWLRPEHIFLTTSLGAYLDRTTHQHPLLFFQLFFFQLYSLLISFCFRQNTADAS